MWFECDSCDEQIPYGTVFFHCYNCRAPGPAGRDNFDICQLCVFSGRACSNPTHDLYPRIIDSPDTSHRDFRGPSAKTLLQSRAASPESYDSDGHLATRSPTANLLTEGDLESLSLADLYARYEIQGQQIRLIRVMPAKTANDAVQCRFFVGDLEQDFEYHALSYVWGDVTSTETIYVNGVPFAATTNLAAYLRARRTVFCGEELFDHEIWIDAICIDQSNVGEKTEQVLMMRKIYERACLVIAWLGSDPDDEYEVPFKIIEIGCEQAIAKTTLPSVEWMEPHASWLCKETGAEDKNMLNPAWNSFKPFFENSYWSRVWTLQEIVVPRNRPVFLQAGTKVIPAVGLFWLAEWIDSVRKCQRPNFIPKILWAGFTTEVWLERHVGFLRVMEILAAREEVGRLAARLAAPKDSAAYARLARRGFASDWSLKVWGWYRRQAQDPRDFIYGYLGLTDLPLKPDYSKPIREVFLEYARLGVQHDLGELLREAGHLDTFDSDQLCWELPSWAPSLNRSQHGRGSVIGHLFPYHADRMLPTAEPFKQEARVESSALILSGIPFDHVVEIHDRHICRANIHKMMHDLLKNRRARSVYHGEIPYIQALIRTLLLDRDKYDARRLSEHDKIIFNAVSTFTNRLFHMARTNEREDVTVRSVLEVLEIPHPPAVSEEDGKYRIVVDVKPLVFGREVCTCPGGHHVQKEKPKSFGVDILYGDDLMYSPLEFYGVGDDGRRLFWTETGYIGMGPASMELGDRIFVIPRCTAPVILKPRGDAFILKGLCFVQGIMDGEVMADFCEGRSQVESIKIV